MAIDYVKLFGDDFDTVLKALDGLTPTAERVLLNSLDKMVFDARTFSNNIQKQITNLSGSGMNRSAIAESLNNDMKTGGRIFGQLKNDVKAGIVDGVQEVARLGQYDNYDLDKGEFTWITVTGHKICPDCVEREGDKGTFNYHEEKGLPGSGWSVCRSYCYCVLDPSGKLPTKVQGVPLKEKRIRKKAPTQPQWKPSMSRKEAEIWAANSETPQEIFHGTRKGLGQNIAKEGFDTTIQGTGSLYGNGVYGTGDLNVGLQYGLDGDLLILKYNLKNPLSLEAKEFWDWGGLATKNIDDLNFTQDLFRKAKFGIMDDQLAKWTPNSFHIKEGIETVEQYVDYVKGTDYYKRFGNRYTGGIDPKTGRAFVSDQINDLSEKFDDFLKQKYLNNDPEFLEMIKELQMGGDVEDLFFKPEWGNLRTEFLEQQGYDGLVVKNARLPGTMNIEKDFDDYFVAFSKESVVVVEN
tara:strand:- start:1006 stop:2400 length:1395 start_codon:yes stop_codon:yes gene_type:complete